MARIADVPTLEPVNKPMESPAEAGKPGQAIAGLGEATNEVAQTGLEFDMFLKKAQEHVDSLAAQNDLAKVYADTQNQLAKTQNSRDVEGVIQDANKSLNDVSDRWSSSPAAIQIQQSADGLRPDLSRIGTVKQVDLMGKEFKVTIAQQAEVLAGSYAADRGTGGTGDMALGAFSTAVKGGVDTHLVGDVEAQEMVRQFRQAGQELQIKNAITNANPEVNTKIYEDIDKHRDKFPDVTQDVLDTLKGQALSAFEAHTKQKDWAEGQMALKTQLAPKINQFTNPATGQFDEAGALKDNAERFAKGEITETQSKVLAEGIDSHYAQLQVAVKQEAGKKLNAVDDLLSKHEFGKARAQMSQDEDWFEKNGLSADHMTELRYMSQMETQVRAEAAGYRAENRAAWQFAQEKKQYDSGQLAGKIQLEIAAGKVYEPMDIKGMETLTDHDKTELISGVKDANGFPNNPYVKDGMNRISELGILDSSKYELARVLVNQVKSGDLRGQAITQAADTLIKEAKTQHSQAWIDQLYRQTTEGRRPDAALDRYMHPLGAGSGGNTVTQSYQGRSVPGLVAEGNLDITRRPNINNGDGTHSSTFSMSFGTDKGEVLVPGVGDGQTYPARKLTTAEALDQYKKTGNNFGTFKTSKDANSYAQKLHQDQSQFGNDGNTRSRPANVPSGYRYEANGSKGAGWYAPSAN